MKNYLIKLLFLFTAIISISPGCIKESNLKRKKQIKVEKQVNNKELDFQVKNETGKTIYVTCFSYIHRTTFDRWRWDKSPIYKLNNNETATVDVDTIKDDLYRKNIYGSLAVFYNEEQAKNATYELLKEKNKLDLEKLYRLKNKIVKIGVEKYGFKGDQLELEIGTKYGQYKNNINKLDFLVENQTGKDLWVCGFVYQKKEDMPLWKFDKTNVQLIKNNETSIIDVDNIKKNINLITGYLGIFEKENKEKAENSTYELLEPKNKIFLGKLLDLQNKKIILEVEKYGFKDYFFEYSIKPIK